MPEEALDVDDVILRSRDRENILQGRSLSVPLRSQISGQRNGRPINVPCR